MLIPDVIFYKAFMYKRLHMQLNRTIIILLSKRGDNLENNKEDRFYLGKYISLLNRHGMCFMNSYMGDWGLSSGEHVYLFYLYNNDGSSQDEISKNLEIDKGTTARAIKKLEDKGFVYRRDDEKDKRLKRVFLKQRAFDIRKDMQMLSEKWKDTLVYDFDDKEIEVMEILIKKLVNNASNYRNLRNKRGDSNV